MDFYKDFECVIFDLDGTLIHSQPAWKDVDIKFMEKRNLPIPQDFYAKVSTMNLAQAADYVRAECGVTEPKDEIIKEWLDMMQYEYAHNIPTVKGAETFVTKLHKAGVKLCLATASEKSFYEPCLTRHGILDKFDALVTTYEVKRGKGFPDVYLLAAERVGVAPEKCCVFEDILPGIIGAKAANMASVAILEPYSQPNHEKMTELADLAISDYTCLL